ncbi:MAG TPA: hypothetical protein VFA24_04310 [Gaiellaceae bacterium]|nr:hypothetical protein [Gaiellaceae bacterium]
MRFLRRLGLLAAVAVGFAVLAGPALATPPDPDTTHTLGTTHFLVHYSTDSIADSSFAITASEAGDFASLAERAYAAETAAGYPPPLADGSNGGDSRIDIYIQTLGQGEAGEADPYNAGPSAGYILLDSQFGLSYHVVAHELFHLIQFGIWASADITDAWLYEATAEWMGYHADAYSTEDGAEPFDVGDNELSLDCRDPNPIGGIQCADDVYDDNGYSRWPFFEYLTERYGVSFVKNIFQQLAITGDGTATTALANALAAQGTTLADTYDAWAAVELNGNYTVPALQGLPPQVYATIQTGSKAATASMDVPVNHLATRVVEFDRGDGDASEACYAATLNLSVALPAGTQSKPAFYWNVKGNAPVQLTVNGSTATASIPWDTCTWASNAGYLALPNASTNVDAADFVVTTSLTVDTSTPASSTPPPAPAVVTTPVVPVSNADVAPTLELFGPEVIQLTPSDTTLRVIVMSNAQGTVQAKIGSTVLGTVALRPGGNDLHFTIPSALLVSLRRAADAASVLTLTPTALNGTTVGQSVTRSVTISSATAAAKVKTKAKPKAKKAATLAKKKPVRRK